MSRYSRHTVLSEIGEDGQRALKKGRIVIIGLGGLGSIMADALVRCGVGNILLIDRDFVELSNLQRQTLYDEEDIGLPKAEVAHSRLVAINSEINLDFRVADVNGNNILDIINDKDLVLDASDNMRIRYILNDACVKEKIPWIYSAVRSTYGMTMNILPEKGPCLSCLLPNKPDPGSFETCASAGILFSLPRMIGDIASTEAVKFLVGKDTREEMLSIDPWRDEFDLTKVKRRDDCKCCVENKFIYLDKEEDITTDLCGQDAVQVSPADAREIDLSDLSDRYKDAEMLGESMLRIRSNGYELNIFKDGRLIVKGTTDKNKAKSLYSTYIGR